MPAAEGDRAVGLRGFLRPTARCRALAVIAAVSVLTTLGSVPSGSAEEIDERRERVEREIDRTEEHLDQSSAQLAASSQQLAQAVTALDGARATLAQSRGELAVAQTLDRQMQVELAEAVEDLSRARAALARGRASVSDGEEALRTIAVQQYASGGPDLIALSTVFTSQNTAQLTSELNSHRSVLDKEAAMLARLEASQVMLAVQEKNFRNAEQEVASRRAAAAENLERKVQLESQAEQTQVRIEDLVVVRSEARGAAAKAETEDLRQLRQLEDERAQVAALLKRRAEEARLQAEAAAEARAEAAARSEAAAKEAARSRAAARRNAAARRESRSRTPKQADERDRAPKPAPSPVEAGLMSPVDGYLTSSYGMRFHPVYQRWSLHDGTDFGASCGTPIRAAASGTVIAMYYNSAYGNRIIMDHGLRRGVGLGTSYNHMSGFSSYVGQNVQRGDIIGYVGTTGASTGCHLHFMVFENGATVDAMTWL